MADSNKPSGAGGGDDQARRLAELTGEMRGVLRELDLLKKILVFAATLIVAAFGFVIQQIEYAATKADAAQAAVNGLSDELRDKEIQRLREENEALKGAADSPSPSDSPDSPSDLKSNSPASPAE